SQPAGERFRSPRSDFIGRRVCAYSRSCKLPKRGRAFTIELPPTPLSLEFASQNHQTVAHANGKFALVHLGSVIRMKQAPPGGWRSRKLRGIRAEGHVVVDFVTGDPSALLQIPM